MTSELHYIGRGVYSLAEASRYTGLHHSRIRPWFKPRSDKMGRGPIFTSDYVHNSEWALSFLDLIDVLVVGELRKINVPMLEIRRCYSRLRKIFKTKHAFCHRKLYADGKRIIMEDIDEKGEAALIEVLTTQEVFKEIKNLLKRVHYSDVTNLAKLWNIAPGVIIDPRRCWGKPVVRSGKTITGISTLVIANNYYGNDEDADFVADLYDIRSADVLNAVEFERTHGNRIAA